MRNNVHDLGQVPAFHFPFLPIIPWPWVREDKKQNQPPPLFCLSPLAVARSFSRAIHTKRTHNETNQSTELDVVVRKGAAGSRGGEGESPVTRARAPSAFRTRAGDATAHTRYTATPLEMHAGGLAAARPK